MYKWPLFTKLFAFWILIEQMICERCFWINFPAFRHTSSITICVALDCAICAFCILLGLFFDLFCSSVSSSRCSWPNAGKYLGNYFVSVFFGICCAWENYCLYWHIWWFCVVFLLYSLCVVHIHQLFSYFSSFVCVGISTSLLWSWVSSLSMACHPLFHMSPDHRLI